MGDLFKVPQLMPETKDDSKLCTMFASSIYIPMIRFNYYLLQSIANCSCSTLSSNDAYKNTQVSPHCAFYIAENILVQCLELFKL